MRNNDENNVTATPADIVSVVKQAQRRGFFLGLVTAFAVNVIVDRKLGKVECTCPS